MTIQYLFLLLLITLQHIKSQEPLQDCQAFIDGLNDKNPHSLKDFNSLSEQEKYYVQYSGRNGSQDLGERELCEQQPSMRYYVLVQTRDPADSFNQVETGICLIKECTKEILESDENRLRDLFRLNNWYINDKPVSVYDVHENIPFERGFYLVLLLNAILVTLGVVSTLILLQKSRNQTKNDTTKALNKITWLLEAFDIKTSLKALWQNAQEQKQNENLATFGFFKTIGSWWVVGVHSIYFTFNTAVHLKEGFDRTGFAILFTQGTFAVELFFFLSGFLSAYVLIAKFQKEEFSLKSFFHHWKHRFVRIWPSCIMAIIFYANIPIYLKNGPLWGRFRNLVSFCDYGWTQKLLLIDNLDYPTEFGDCANWTWYVSVELQSFPWVLLLVFIYTKSRAAGYIGTIMSILLSFISAKDGLIFQRFTKYYIYTPARMGEIFIGILFGLHYYDYVKLNIKNNFFWVCKRFLVLRYLFILIGLCLMYYLVCYVHVNSDLFPGHSFEEPERRNLVCAVIGLIIGPIVVPGTRWLKWLLNLRIWQILGKLSFSLYLFHMVFVDSIVFGQEPVMETFSFGGYFVLYVKAILLAYVLCVFYWVFLDRPIIAIETYFDKKAHARKGERQMLKHSDKLAISTNRSMEDVDTKLSVVNGQENSKVEDSLEIRTN